MPTFWDMLEQRLGRPLSDQTRRYLQLRGADRHWKSAPAPERERIVRGAVAVIEDLQAAGFVTAEIMADADPEPRPGATDPRWSLWRDLRAAGGAAADWQPFQLRRVFDVSTDNPALLADRVEVSFDHRLSRRAVVAALEKAWPRLSEAGWIRATRTMEARAAALVRFVCLENPPGTPWRTLMAYWNSRYPRWSHKSPRDFESRFRRAEQQLTGYSRGLEWFYSLEARRAVAAPLTIGRLEELARLHPSVQRHALRHLRSMMYGALQQMGRNARANLDRLANGAGIEDVWPEGWSDIPPAARGEVAASLLNGMEHMGKLPDESDIGDSKAE